MTEAEMQVALAREDLCRYLAASYYEPDPAFDEEGMFAALVAAAGQIDASLVPDAESLAQAFHSAPADALLLEYTRLFLGPMEILAQPYGSVWLSGDKTLMGETSMAVLDMYQEGGFEMDEEFRELPDHIAAELEFLYLLLFRENEALGQEDAGELAAVAALKKRFLLEHLGRWVPDFTAAVAKSSQSAFYRHLAVLTLAFVKLEVRRSQAA